MRRPSSSEGTPSSATSSTRFRSQPASNQPQASARDGKQAHPNAIQTAITPASEAPSYEL